MKLHYVLIGLACLLLAATPFNELDKDQKMERIAAEVNEAITKADITDMMSASMRLKEAGGSYQEALTYPMDTRFADDPEAMRVLIGVRQFDALYAAAFGKKQAVTSFLKAQNDLVMQLNLKGRVDVAAVFPPELNWMVREPDKVDFKDIVAAYADNIDRYNEMGKDPAGLDVIGDALYGFVVEGLYITGQSVIQAGSDPQMMRVINGMAPSLNALTHIYKIMETDKDYAAYVDPAQLLDQGARMGWVKELADMITRKGGNLSGSELQAIAAFAVEQRKTIGQTGR